MSSSSSRRDIKRPYCGDRICKCCSIFSIQILNILDIILGGFLVAIGIYILATNSWGESLDLVTLIWPIVSVVIGLLLFIEVLLSCCAAASEGRRYMASISGYLALGFCFLTLGAGMAAFINKSNVHQYLENHKSELGDQHVETIETWYITVGVCMFVVSALQMIRYCLSSRFVRSADRLDDAYIILIDDDGDEVREEQNRNATTSKFKNMRNQYADKYAKMENESKEQWQSRN